MKSSSLLAARLLRTSALGVSLAVAAVSVPAFAQDAADTDTATADDGGSSEIEKNTPPKYVSGVSTNVGMIEMSSKLLAKIALKRPAIENTTAVSTIVVSVINGCATSRSVKNNATTTTSAATSRPRTTPPTTKPSTIVVCASGATSISSRCSISLLEKNDDTTFANEFVMTDIMIKPGAMNVMYGTPSISPMRRPTRLPKMMKYRVIVIAGGTIV